VARAFKRRRDKLVARLDDVEREVVVALLRQTHDFLAPEPREPTGDPFDDLVARLGMPRLTDMNDIKDMNDIQDMQDMNDIQDRQDSAGEADQAPEGLRDPAMERLLPSAHRDDPALSAEFRRLTEHGLRELKAANLMTAIAALKAHDGDMVRLDLDQAQATVVALTDVRLLLGERLGLRTDEDADALQERFEAASEDDPRLHLAAYYDFMTWLQESLIQALMA